MTQIIRLIRNLSMVPLVVACVTLFSLMMMTFFDVVLRSAINAPIEAAPELTRMAVAIVVFSTLPILSFKGDHISVDLLDGVFARFGLIRIRDAVVALACGALLWLPANRVVVLAERSRSYGDLTEFLNIPVFYMTWFIAIMTFISCFALILRGLLLLFAPRLLESQT